MSNYSSLATGAMTFFAQLAKTFLQQLSAAPPLVTCCRLQRDWPKWV